MLSPLCPFCKQRHWDRVCPTLAPNKPTPEKPRVIRHRHILRAEDIDPKWNVTSAPRLTKTVTENPPGVTKKRGRPKKAVTLTSAERVRAHRARKLAK